ncbi:sigma-70 family RNA polymerase sigma factor [Polymorphum gilvum]|uniref:RNA polymerase sigma factor n=1 Tax=Polymorphum gilvum (strain LMG 25793 / CGMCC 1.9160 / SL003B-26A1) TaxID=991905 RepID=F2J080_POLGS|nr:sigma-70 family RNA polymerase sigma factor [Polymorphum gilvum]ADZ68615.1 RNA polymerase sigma factor [Polymorphum gilvum SL003B-26A1]
MAEAHYYSALIEKVAASRDREAFAELFDHFAPRIKGYLMQQGADAATAEEVAQDAMVILWRKAELFDSAKSSASTWLFRIARNRRIDLLRRQRTAELDPEEPALQPSAPEDVDTTLDAGLREERVRLALQQLPDTQREVVRQAFFLGLSHSEIAEATGLPLGTVKSRIRLAFARLRELLEADAAVDID